VVCIFLATGFEEIEAIATIDILRRAKIDIKIVGVGDHKIIGAHNIKVEADITEKELNFGDIEMIILPGGMPGTTNLENNQTVQSAIDYVVNNNGWIAAICAAPSILGHKGLLKGKNVTCYPGYENDLIGANITCKTVELDSKIITGKGAGVTMDFAFAIISCIKDEKIANEIRGAMQCR
jgi:4-methyl-5(b-hydroxyethyl)-thiazole monophosphate biosynthesis